MRHSVGWFAGDRAGCYECQRPANTDEQRRALENSECAGSMYLNNAAEFDSPFRINADGSVSDGPAGLYAPDLYDEELSDDAWEMVNGYSGQDRYAGPIMHNSEYLGGGMARDILNSPGVYVVVAAAYSPDEDDDEEETIWEGWALCHYTGEDK